jgi:hypothetical protein
MEGEASEVDLVEDWAVVEGMLPLGWEGKARELGAFLRGRQIRTPQVLLKILLIHLSQGCSLRETALRAREGGLAELSDVAVMKRLRRSGSWFSWMLNALQKEARRGEERVGEEWEERWAGRRLRIVDGTRVSEPGATGTKWFVHYAMGLLDLCCDEVKISLPEEGETLKRYVIEQGDLLIGDRGYAHASGIAHVVGKGGDVLVRSNLVTLPFYDEDGKRIDPLERLRTLSEAGQSGSWPVWIRSGEEKIQGRLCGVRKSEDQTKKARERVQREAQRSGTRQIREETLEAARYVLVFTTLEERDSAETVLELYRARWQVEIAFQRLKSLMQLGHLKKQDETSARAWLQGKLLVAYLMDRIRLVAERISPWGYEFWKGAPSPLSLARDRLPAGTAPTGPIAETLARIGPDPMESHYLSPRRTPSKTTKTNDPT